MEPEAKVDQDYLFYLGFTSTFFQRISDAEVKTQCQHWLQKLLSERCEGLQRKRCRNIYLTHLLICMQTGQLEGPFRLPPAEVDIADAYEVFEPFAENLTTEPDWLKEKNDVPASDGNNAKEGRTYIATRILPGGAGAFAYVAISMGEEEPKWIGGGEGVLERKLSDKFREFVPPQYEMEKILARRKDPKEREKVLTFYDVLKQNIADELDGVIPPHLDATVNGLVEQLIEDLKEKGLYEPFETLSDHDRRNQLLLVLYDRIHVRRNKIAKREEILDEIEQKLVPKEVFDTSALPEDRYELPSVMWEQAINKYPNKRNMDRLKEMYPMMVIEKFCELLANQKEDIAKLVHKRHENIITQMKKELRLEGEKGQINIERAKANSDESWKILLEVRNAHKARQEVIERNRDATTLKLSEHSKLYDQMREALMETQKNVEEEAARGHELAAEINAVSNQTDLYVQINDETMRKTEETNMAIMRNLKRMRAAVKQYETRIAQLKSAGLIVGARPDVMIL